MCIPVYNFEIALLLVIKWRVRVMATPADMHPFANLCENVIGSSSVNDQPLYQMWCKFVHCFFRYLTHSQPNAHPHKGRWKPQLFGTANLSFLTATKHKALVVDVCVTLHIQVLLYCEGTRFTKKKHHISMEVADRYCYYSYSILLLYSATTHWYSIFIFQ